MKKIIALQVLMLTVLIVNAQSGLKWQKMDSFKDKYNFETFIRASDNAYDAVFTIPHNKPFKATKHSIFFRRYDKNMIQLSEIGIPPESPLTVRVSIFRNYNVFSGCMSESKILAAQAFKDRKVVIADENMNTLVNKTLSLHNKKNHFEELPTLYTSPDSSFLIVVSKEFLPGKFMKESPVVYYVNVYDKSLNLVWNDSINTEVIFGQDVRLDNVSFSFIEDKLLLSASVDKSKLNKTAARVYLLEFDKPQSYKMILKEDYPEDLINLHVLYTNKGQVYLSGTNQQSVSEDLIVKAGLFKRKLFYIKVDIKNSNEAPVIKNYDINKDFVAKYPDYKEDLLVDFSFPTQLIVINDDLYYICENRYATTTTASTASGSTSSSTTYHFNGITLLKFDTKGDIQWLKMIVKNVNSKSINTEGNCQAFRSGNNICLFYYDYLDNVTSGNGRPKFFSSDLKLWLTRALISLDGELHSKVITNIGDDKITTDLPKTLQMNDTRFLITGKGHGGVGAALDEFYSYYDLE